MPKKTSNSTNSASMIVNKGAGDSVESLTSKFKHTVKELKRYENKLPEFISNNDIYFMKSIKLKVEKLCSKLDEVYFHYLEVIEIGETENDLYDIYTEAEDVSLNTLSRIDKFIAENEVSNTQFQVQSHDIQTSSIKLPKFELPIFYGDFSNWITFRELFKSSIGDNNSLSNIQKMQYLLSNCRNQALKLISGFPLSEDSFDNAWQTLCKRFDNTKELAFCQLNKIFNPKQFKITNSKSLLEVLDSCNEALRNLKGLGLERNSLTELIIIHNFQARLDESVRQRWELLLDTNEIPSYDKFICFLEKEAGSSKCVMKEREFSKVNKNLEGSSKSGQNKSLVNTVVKNESSRCAVCNEPYHPIHKCPTFNQMKIDQRWKLVKSQKLCVNCLRNNHFVHNCQITTSCKSCKERHHTLLHAFKPQGVIDSLQENQSNTSHSMVNTACYANNLNEGNTLLSTAIIRVKTANGNYVKCRSLVDNGSQTSLISKTCCDKLNLKTNSKTRELFGVNQTAIQTTFAEVVLKIKSQFQEEEFETSALVVDNVTVNLPNFTFDPSTWSHLKNLKLADPTYSVSSAIDILIGADLYNELLIGHPIHGEKGSPSAINTKLGWIISGRICGESPHNALVNCHAISSLDRQLQRFWEIETIPINENLSDDDKICEDFFNTTVTRDVDGRYIVRLPFKSKPEFGNSSNQALKRFKSLEFKLNKDSVVKSQYSEFMSEYIKLNHMQLVSENDKTQVSSTFYLPHHFVIKSDSTTTKLRVVFDASAKDSHGNSLNDMLHIGPRLQADLYQILLKFRTFPIAMTSDVEKMFRQIRVHETDTDFQRIVWRFSPEEPIQTFRLLTVTYGTAAAPYLAIKTLQQLAKDEMENFPEASRVILNNFYVDDLLVGADSVEEAKALVNDVTTVLNRGGFNLRKWATNCPEILSDIPVESKSSFNTVDIEENQSLKVLGLFWNFGKDTLQIKIADLINPTDVHTKRHLLSFIAKIFDPLGFLAPTTILLKILMQQLWKDKLSWDDTIPTEISKVWEKFKSQITVFREIQLPRFISSNAKIQSIQLHGFADASMKAYSSVIYIRIVLKSGEVMVNLVTAKTRVAPLKSLTLPRLELCAAVLLAKLYKSVSEVIDIAKDVYLWSDSEITLAWIKSESPIKDQFVRNRVNLITTMTSKTSWNHISGSMNPADCASRGIFPNDLLKHDLWWKGPPWLHEDNLVIEPRVNHINCTNLYDCGLSDQTEVVTQVTVVPNFVCKYSSFSKLIRVTAYILRFVHNLRNLLEKRKGVLSTDEYRQAIEFVVRIVQTVEFQQEISLLKQNRQLPKASKLLCLNPFLDSKGILRVGGRLSKHITLTYDKKHPMILPKGHHVTKLIIIHYHHNYLHAGPQLVLSATRQHFWILNGRSTVRHELLKCLTCFKLRATPERQIMGDLPTERLTMTRPFLKVGIDFAGPIFVKPNVKRSTKKFKAYICLIICMCTKAVHLELVSELSTEALIAALRRFFSRRGLSTDIFSDNATNFKGAANHLNQLFQLCRTSRIQEFCTSSFVKWHFIPPYSPNFGGLWEASIKITKKHLIRVCKSSLLNFEEMSTLLCEIEACINSRPITPLSSDPTDLQALTPGHFIIGTPLKELPDSAEIIDHMSLSTRWRMIQNMRLHFWTRWSREYLHQLQPRSKWKTSCTNLQTGDLVLLHDKGTSPLQWTIGRVSKVHAAADQTVRVVSIKTKNGEVRRAISKVSRLPVASFPGAEDVGY